MQFNLPGDTAELGCSEAETGGSPAEKAILRKVEQPNGPKKSHLELRKLLFDECTLSIKFINFSYQFQPNLRVFKIVILFLSFLCLRIFYTTMIFCVYILNRAQHLENYKIHQLLLYVLSKPHNIQNAYLILKLSLLNSIL